MAEVHHTTIEARTNRCGKQVSAPEDILATSTEANETKNRRRSRSQETTTTALEDEESASDSSVQNSLLQEAACIIRSPDDGLDSGERIITTLSSTNASKRSLTNPTSAKSASSQQWHSSSSVSNEEDMISVRDLKRVHDLLLKSLQEEQRLLDVQQELLNQMEAVGHSIVKADYEERLSRVASQQTRIMTLLTRSTE